MARWIVWVIACVGCAPRPVVITDVAIVDVVRGETTAPRTIVIRDGRIAEIGADVRIPDDADRIDGRGRYVMPGLIDMHVHLFAGGGRTNAWALAWFVAAGVTTVREMAARPDGLRALRGWRGPRIVAGVPVRRAEDVDVAADAGADFLKVFSELAEARWRAVLAAARRRGLAVIGHVPAGVALLEAARAGQRGAAHLMQAFEACTADEPRWLAGRTGLSGDALVARRDADEPAVLEGFDPVVCARVATALAALGQVQDPTLVLAWTEAQPDADPARDPRWPPCPPPSARGGRGSWRSAARRSARSRRGGGRSRARSSPRSRARAWRSSRAPTRRCRGSIPASRSTTSSRRWSRRGCPRRRRCGRRRSPRRACSARRTSARSRSGGAPIS